MTLYGPGRAAQRVSGRRGLRIYSRYRSPGLHQAAASGSLCFRMQFYGNLFPFSKIKPIIFSLLLKRLTQLTLCVLDLCVPSNAWKLLCILNLLR